jgi:hypothetical protein
MKLPLLSPRLFVPPRCIVCRRLASSSEDVKPRDEEQAANFPSVTSGQKVPNQSQNKATYNPLLLGDEPKEDFFPREFHEQLKQHPKLKDNKFYQRLMDDRERL